jgi:FixJ family two-component response regulator
VKKPVISILDHDELVRQTALDLVKSMGFVREAFPLAKTFLRPNIGWNVAALAISLNAASGLAAESDS